MSRNGVMHRTNSSQSDITRKFPGCYLILRAHIFLDEDGLDRIIVGEADDIKCRHSKFQLTLRQHSFTNKICLQSFPI